MKKPSSQVVSNWLEESFVIENWTRIDVAIDQILQIKLKHWSETDRSDLVDEYKKHVSLHLLESRDRCKDEGKVFRLEVDNDELPYIRCINPARNDLLKGLRSLDPRSFEIFCKELLTAMGGDASVTQETRDGGVDFFAFNLPLYDRNFPMPWQAKCVLTGQAKRYKDGLFVSEKEMREFVGAALLRINEFRVSRKVLPVTPLLFAFWTTSRFDSSAKSYANKMGIWTIEGDTLADHVVELGLETTLLSLLRVDFIKLLRTIKKNIQKLEPL